MSSSPRPTWDETRLAEARVISHRSLCIRDQVGAVIVDARQRVVAQGYNGPPAGFPHHDRPCNRWCARAKPEITFEITTATQVQDDITVDNGHTYLDRPDGRVEIHDTYGFFVSRGYTPVEHISPCYDDCPALHAEANALSVCDRSTREGGTIYVTSHVCYACAKLIANSGLARVVVQTLRPDDHRNPTRSYNLLIECLGQGRLGQDIVTLYDAELRPMSINWSKKTFEVEA